MHEPGTRSRIVNIPWTVIRVAFLGLALLAFWGGFVRWEAWTSAFRFSRGSVTEVTEWVIWLALVALAGFLFGLAAVPPTTLRYRIGPPLLLATIPVLLIAHAILVFAVGWQGPPRFLAYPRFYMSPSLQWGLATWVGVAFVSGFRHSTPPPETESLE